MICLAGLVGVPYSPTLILGVFVMQTLLAYTLTAFGVMVAARIKQIQSFMALTQMLVMPLFFVSGAMFPLTGLPTWLTVLNRLDPLTYAVEPIRRVVFDHLTLDPAGAARLDPGVTWGGWHVTAAVCAAVVLALGVMHDRHRDRRVHRKTSNPDFGGGSRRTSRMRSSTQRRRTGRLAADVERVDQCLLGALEARRVVGVQLEQRLAGARRGRRAWRASPRRRRADTGSSLRARPAPSRQAATPTASASSRVSTPVAGAVTTCRSRGDRQRRQRVAALRRDHRGARRPSPGRRAARRPGRRR